MTKLRLGINAGFATNRFPEPEVWLRIVDDLKKSVEYWRKHIKD